MPTASDPTYLKGRAVSRLLEIFGWLTAALGVTLLGLGLWWVVSPPVVLAVYGLLGSVVLMGMGIVIGITGLIAVQQALTSRATFQTAQDTRSLLGQHRKTAHPAAPSALRAEPSLSRPTPR